MSTKKKKKNEPFTHQYTDSSSMGRGVMRSYGGPARGLPGRRSHVVGPGSLLLVTASQGKPLPGSALPRGTTTGGVPTTRAEKRRLPLGGAKPSPPRPGSV